jgi:hypothetical protein
LIEKIIFLRIFPAFNLNSFLQTHLGAVDSHVSAFLIETSYFGRAEVILYEWGLISHLNTFSGGIYFRILSSLV